MALPNEIHPFAIAGGGNQYQIANSLRFRNSGSAYLSKTFGVAGNRKTWTYSVWIKRGSLGIVPYIFMGGTSLNDTGGLGMGFGTNDCFYIQGYTTTYLQTTQVFRDPSAWYHIVIALDSTQATATNRLLFYVNGSQVTTFTTDNRASITQNLDLGVNQAALHTISYQSAAFGATYYDGYMTEINFVDGFQYGPSYFGQTDTVTNQWLPKKYTGTYGTNGFYLPFNDATSTTTIGYDRQLGMSDSSKNNWTASGISVTSGTTYDSMIDSPTNYNDGSTYYNRGSYCTLNPLDKYSGFVLQDGNIKSTDSGSGQCRATIGMTTGKWYWEFTSLASGTYKNCDGIATSLAGLGAAYLGADAYGWSYYSYNGNKYNNGSGAAYGSTYTTNDVIGVAFDADNGALYFSKNNVWQNSGDPTSGATKTGAAFTGLTSGPYFPATGWNGASAASAAYNFGQRPFNYTPPTGYKALNTYNLADPSLPLV